MTNDETMPNVIWAYETNCKNSKGFGHWYDEDVSGDGKENQCTKYHRAQEPIEGLKEAVEWFNDWLAGIEGDDSRYFKTILQAAKRQLESEE